MTALDLLRTVAKLNQDPEKFHIWYSQQVVTAGLRAKNRSRQTGNRKISRQDAADIVQEAWVQVRLAAMAETGPCPLPSPARHMTLDEAADQFLPYIDKAITAIHKQTRPTRSKFRHELPWPHPYKPIDETQLEDYASKERIERAEIIANDLILGTKYNSKVGTGRYLTKLGYIVSQSMTTSDISSMFNKKDDAAVHQYRSRAAKLLGIMDPAEIVPPSIKKNPKA